LPKKKKSQTNKQKKETNKKPEREDCWSSSIVICLQSKDEALSLNPSTAKGKKKNFETKQKMGEEAQKGLYFSKPI
jgi:hypothetical protein